MKIVPLLMATAFAAVIGATPLLAQSADTQSEGGSQSGSQMDAPTHPGPNQWDRDRDWYGGAGGYGYGWMNPHAGWMMGGGPGRMMGQQGPGWRGHRGWRRWHRRARGARFTFTRGNSRVDIRCPADQKLKDCVDAASTLMDKVSSMGPSSSAPPDTSKPPAGNSGSGPMPGHTPGSNMPGSNMPGGNMPDRPGNRM